MKTKRNKTRRLVWVVLAVIVILGALPDKVPPFLTELEFYNPALMVLAAVVGILASLPGAKSRPGGRLHGWTSMGLGVLATVALLMATSHWSEQEAEARLFHDDCLRRTLSRVPEGSGSQEQITHSVEWHTLEERVLLAIDLRELNKEKAGVAPWVAMLLAGLRGGLRWLTGRNAQNAKGMDGSAPAVPA